MMEIALITYTILAPFVNRMRGGGWRICDWLPAHKVFAYFYFALPFFYLGWDVGVGAFALIWSGFSIGWGEYFDMSNRPNDDEVAWIDWVLSKFNVTNLTQDIIGMSLRGLHLTVPLALVGAYIYNPLLPWFAPLGLGMGGIYYGAKYWMNFKSKVLDIINPRAHAEYIFGGYLAVIYSGMLVVAI